jgi:hypothetical protein
MQKIANNEELKEILSYSEGYLVNCYSNVNNNNMHVIHVLPLVSQCRGDIMRLNPAYPKYYVTNRAELAQFGIQEQKWNFGKCCQGRPGTF